MKLYYVTIPCAGISLVMVVWSASLHSLFGVVVNLFAAMSNVIASVVGIMADEEENDD